VSSVTIEWIVPPPYDPVKAPTGLNANLTYSVNVYSSSGGETGTYSLIANISAGPSNTTTTYTDGNGDPQFFYYVTYVPAGGVEGNRVLARIQCSVREQRLRDKVYGLLPEVVAIRMDANRTQVRDALKSALGVVNSYAPVTSYTLDNMPAYHEVAVEVGAQIFLYLEVKLQISIRDFSYGVSGIALTVDRGARIQSAIDQLTKYWTDLLKVVKFYDYPDPIGLGSTAMSEPFAKVFSTLYNIPL
jgi:hypothetical protein